MAYNIYHSNNLSQFIEEYSNLFHTNSLFGEKVITIVQNKNIASWLQYKLAEVDGISLDLEFEYPENGVKELIRGYETGRNLLDNNNDPKSILFMDSLKIVLYKSLEVLLSDDSNFPDLYSYVNGSPKRLFQLSDSIAGLFYHYGMNCPQMVSSWDKGNLYISEDGKVHRKEDQLWQMRLWKYIFNPQTPYLHISNVLNRVLESSDNFDPLETKYGRCKIILFGSSFLGESSIRFFNRVSRDIDVIHFILTPSEIYSREEFLEPKSLLKKFSGLIEGFTNISRESDFKKTRESSFVKSSGDSLLDFLKNGIEENSLSEINLENKTTINGEDSSIKVCKVVGKWREVEVLKDKVLSLLNRDPNLKLTDIGIVAPDINEYVTYIEGIFPDREIDPNGVPIFGPQDIPYNIMGLNGGEDSPFIRGLMSLLEIPGTNFNRKDIINIISNPCFMERFNISLNDKELFLNSISNLNIKWGLDGAHRGELGYESSGFNTWEDGFKRVLLGIALDRESNPDIPYNLSDSQSVESLGTLIHILRSMYNDLWGLNGLKLHINEWVLYIETVMDTYLKPLKNSVYDERERLGVKNQYRNILNLLDDLKELSNFKDRTLPFSVFKSLLKEFILKASGNKGRYLTQGVTFSSIKPLRAVPFKHIFVLGLNEDIFPGREKIPSYDLRGIYEQKIDLSKRQNDKFAFLEILLSAKDSLTLFYNGKNQISGEELQPSVVISELFEAIECNFDLGERGINNLIENHPLHNFDSIYFTENSGLKSFNRRAYKSALVYSGDKEVKDSDKFDLDSLNLESIEITVDDLVKFLRNPVKTFFNKGEGIYIDEEIPIEEDIYENKDLDFLIKWKFANIVMEKGLDNIDSYDILLDEFFKIAEKEGVFKDSILTKNTRTDIEDTTKAIDSFLVESNLKGTSYKRVNRDLGGEFTPLNFNINGIDVKLTGELTDLWVDGNDCFNTKISLSQENTFKLKDKIKPFIYSKIIDSHPEMNETSFKAYSIGKKLTDPIEFKLKNNGSDFLVKVCLLYIKNLATPIPLYPDLLEGKDGVIEKIEDNWKKKRNDDFNFNEINNCPYIKLAYGDSEPIFNLDDLAELYNQVFKEIIEAE